jgi:hypothetical protein
MGTGWQLDEEPEEPGPVVVGGGTAVEPPVGCDPLGPEDCEPVSPGPVVVAGPEVAQLPGLGGAVAQAQTEEAPAMTAWSDAAGQAVATQGTRS